MKAIMYSLMFLLLMGSVAAVEPHTRFTHLNEHCIYYDGVQQCKLVHDYCDPDGGDTPQELGLCTDLSSEILIDEVQPRASPVIDRNNCPITVTEGELVKIKWIGSDPDEDIGPQGELTYEYEGVVGEEGTWQTKRGDAGIHEARARVFDGEFWDETALCIEVLKANGPAKVKAPSTITVDEGDTVNLKASCEDEDGDPTTIEISGWMTSQTKKTGYEDAGEYTVEVNCVDDSNEGESKDIKVIVENKNRPPMIEWEQA